MLHQACKQKLYRHVKMLCSDCDTDSSVYIVTTLLSLVIVFNWVDGNFSLLDSSKNGKFKFVPHRLEDFLQSSLQFFPQLGLRTVSFYFHRRETHNLLHICLCCYSEHTLLGGTALLDWPHCACLSSFVSMLYTKQFCLTYIRKIFIWQVFWLDIFTIPSITGIMIFPAPFAWLICVFYQPHHRSLASCQLNDVYSKTTWFSWWIENIL